MSVTCLKGHSTEYTDNREFLASQMIKPQLLNIYVDNYNIQTTCVVSYTNISRRPHNLCHLF
jgi:hypothetical protein